jgi:hypothetical protein
VGLQKYLKAKWISIDEERLYSLLRIQGCKSAPVRIKGKVICAWLFARSNVNMQTEDYSSPTFDDDHDEDKI